MSTNKIARPCPVGHKPHIDNNVLGHGCSIICDCYDGAPDAGSQLAGWALKLEDAIDDWNEQVEEALEELSK